MSIVHCSAPHSCSRPTAAPRYATRKRNLTFFGTLIDHAPATAREPTRCTAVRGRSRPLLTSLGINAASTIALTLDRTSYHRLDNTNYSPDRAESRSTPANSHGVHHPLQRRSDEPFAVQRQFDAHRCDAGLVGHHHAAHRTEGIQQDLVVPHHTGGESGDAAREGLIGE